MKTKENNGITLVALVVTIVVLLILAGVSINLVLGENGLITQAKEAKRKTEEVQNSEEKGLNNAANYIKQNVGITSAEITAIDYGKAVTNYNMGEKTWEIFFADNSNIYLITRENCGQKTLTDVSSEYNGTIDFDGSEKFKMKFPAVQAGWLNKVYEPSENGKGTIKYSSSYENMKVTEYLLDSSIWNQKYLDTEKGDWVIGASTLELLVESYNKKNENNKVEIGEVQEFGYDNPLKEQDILGNIDRTEEKEQQSLNIYNHGYSYWLASPSKTLDIYERGVNYKKGYVNSNGLEGVLNIRPVVRLKTGTILKLNSDGTTYTIE